MRDGTADTKGVTMPNHPEVRSHWLMTCRDPGGRDVTIGAGVTRSNSVVIFGPPGRCVLTEHQAVEYLHKVRSAWFAAHGYGS
jgi:hypothetical protein